jgi:hypothetical protein
MDLGGRRQRFIKRQILNARRLVHNARRLVLNARRLVDSGEPVQGAIALGMSWATLYRRIHEL